MDQPVPWVQILDIYLQKNDFDLDLDLGDLVLVVEGTEVVDVYLINIMDDIPGKLNGI